MKNEKGGDCVLKFQFECSDEKRVRADFENMMLRDAPCGKGIWGNDLLRSGIHFKECGEKIKGFYISESEREGTRGSPLRVSFVGRFIKNGDKQIFEVLIYPKMVEFLFILIAYISISIATELIGFVVSTVIFAIFMIGYFKGIKETADFFRQWVR